MKYILPVIISIIGAIQLSIAATIKGKVVNGNDTVNYARIWLKNTNHGTATDKNGNYIIENVPAGTYTLTAKAIGFNAFYEEVTLAENETVKIDINLKENEQSMNEVVITGTMKETYILESPVKVEVLTSEFLKTNPTNNIIEALQTVNGVQEQINCGVCATNDIHINGMEGPYTLVLIDGMPIMSALASVYGFNGIPNSMIDRVEIVKGPSSTLYGTEAVGGVINIITKKAEKMPLLNMNSFYTSHRELNTDFSFTPEIGDKVVTTLSGNYYRNQYRMDFNNDNFTDIPLNNRFSLFNKWHLKRKKDRIADLGIRYYTEDRFGGVMQWQQPFRGSDSVYGESILTNRIEVIGSYQLPTKEYFRVDFSYNLHNQDSYYGDTYYKADQSVYFANLIWNKEIERHDILSGLTYRYQTYEDNSPADTDEERFIPGVFVQDEYSITAKTTLLGGIRFDYHKAHGMITSPRLNVKHKLGRFTTARLNLGTGFRLVHLFTEDHAALTGSRTVSIEEDLQPEESYNATLNLNHIYTLGASNGTLDLDLFYTYFTNKIIPDYETNKTLIIYDNLDGYGITRGASISWHHYFTFPLTVKIGGTFQDVFEMAEGKEGVFEKEPQIFAPKFSGTFNIGYKIRKWNLSIDYTGRVMGPQHLPTFDPPFSRPEISPWFSLQNVQFTKDLGHAFELYAGIKNILNYTQASPLIDPANPFSDYFDTVYAYGPLQVRRFYGGIRWSLRKK